MKKHFLSILILSILGCSNKESEIGLQIEGQFDTQGEAKVVKIAQTKFGNGRIEDGKPNEYIISFNNGEIKPIEMICACSNPILINEGDLNNDGIDEISVASISKIDSIIVLETYSVANKRFKLLLLSTIGVKKEVEQSKLQSFIVKEGDNIIQNSYFDGISVNKKGETNNKIQKKVIKVESLN